MKRGEKKLTGQRLSEGKLSKKSKGKKRLTYIVPLRRDIFIDLLHFSLIINLFSTFSRQVELEVRIKHGFFGLRLHFCVEI